MTRTMTLNYQNKNPSLTLTLRIFALASFYLLY
jgi:hypothetical protein